MTRAVPFTQAAIRRAIRAAEKEGLRVIGIRPDGSIILERGEQKDRSTEDHESVL